jgi:hypothetical protein
VLTGDERPAPALLNQQRLCLEKQLAHGCARLDFVHHTEMLDNELASSAALASRYLSGVTRAQPALLVDQ